MGRKEGDRERGRERYGARLQGERWGGGGGGGDEEEVEDEFYCLTVFVFD